MMNDWKQNAPEDELFMPEELRLKLSVLFIKIHGLTYVERTVKWRLNRVPKRFADISDNDCWTKFRFRKKELWRLLKVMRFDEEDEDEDEEAGSGTFLAQNGTRFTGQELLMIGLHRLANTGSLKTSMSATFELDYSQLSRAFAMFIDHVLDNHSHLLTDNLHFWAPYFPGFAEAIRSKLAEKCGVHFPEGSFRVAAFHDCTVIASCRPGGGPVGPGVDAERVDNFIQMAFYSGWKKHHGFKYLTLEAPNGSCCPC